MSSALDGRQQAPVYTIGEDRGPNLNKRASRNRTSDDDYEFDWNLPELSQYRPPLPPPSPSPPPSPINFPSYGGTPVPETPPPLGIFEPTEYEKAVEADDYDERVRNH